MNEAQPHPSSPLLAGIELGGTKCVCLVGTGPEDIRARVTVPTTDPDSTLAQLNSILDGWQSAFGSLHALGIASFGPIDLRRDCATFGRVTADAKPGWAGTDVFKNLGARRGIPVALNTDVNGAALAEGRWGAARSLDDYAYITVGTGVGVGLIVGGRPVFGCHHTELGHIRIARHPADQWPGACRFHGDCVEGLVSGPAIAARAGVPGHDIPATSPIWEFVAHALGQLFHTLLLSTAPRRILIGGGVVENHPELLAAARKMFIASVNGYLKVEALTGKVEQYIIPPQLGPLAGPLGALALAANASDSW